MTVGYKLIRETFTSRVALDKPNLKLRVEYIDGPFSRLENIWTFKDEVEEDGSRGSASSSTTSSRAGPSAC